MPYVKRKYINGLYAPMNWYEQLNIPVSWDYKLNTTNDMDWQNKLKTINEFNWDNKLATAQDLGFTGTKYTYRPNTQEATQSTLVNYNDPSQINSIRDIVLGSFNPNMQHSQMFGNIVSKIPILNIIPDTLQYVNDFVVKPISKGEWKEAGINQLMNVAETLDVLANPIKGAIIAIQNGEDPLKAIQAATFGTEEGIKNFDYDTGTFVADLVLEIVSDPLNWISFGGKAAVTGVAKSGAKEFIGEGAESLVKTATKEAAQELTEASMKSAAKEVTTEVGQTYTNKASRELAQKGLANYSKEEITEAVEHAFTKGMQKSSTNAWVPGTRSKMIKGIIRDNVSDALLESSNQKFLKVFTKTLNKELGIDAASLLSESVIRGMRNSITDLNSAIYKKVAGTITGSLGMRAIKTEDWITSGLLKTSLYPSGVYGLYKLGTSKPIKGFLESQVLKRVSDVVSNRYLSGGESFLKAGAKNGYIQVAHKEIELSLMFPELAKAQDPQQAIAAIGVALGKDLDSIKKILKDSTIPNTSKREMVNGILQKLDTYHAINSIDDYLIKLEDLSEVTKKFDGTTLNRSGLEQYLTEFYGIRKALNTIDNIETAKGSLQALAQNIESAKAIKQLNALKVFDDYSVKEILKAIDNQVVLDTVQNIPINYLDNLTVQYQKAVAGQLTNLQIQDLQQKFQKIFIEPYRMLTTSNNALLESNTKYLIKNMEQVLNNMFTPKRGVLRPSIVNNLQNISNRLRALVSDNSPLFVLDNIAPGLYEDILFVHKNVLGTDTSSLNVDLIAQLKKHDNYVPNPELAFTDSELYKWADDINNRYNDLLDYIEKNEKYIEVATKEVNTAAYKEGMVRIEELQNASEDVIKSSMKLNITDVDAYEYIERVLDKESILAPAQIKKVYQSLDVLKDFGERFGRVYDYNENLFESTKGHLDYYMRLLNSMNAKRDDATFKALYGKLRQQHNLLMTDFRELGSIINTKNAWELKNAGLDSLDLSGLGKGVTRPGAVGKVPIQFPEELEEAYSIIKQAEDTLCEIDFGAIDLREIVVQFDTDIYLAQLDNIYVTNMLNNNEALERLRQDENLMNLIEHVPDMDNPALKFAYQNFTEDDKYAFRLMYLKLHAKDNFNRVQNNIMAWYESLPSAIKPKYVNAKNALITTLANYRTANASDIASNFNKFMEGYMRKVQGYITGSDPLMTSYKLDALKAKYKITDADVLNEVKQIKGLSADELTEAQRHTALFDTAAQIKVVEAYTGKPYYGMMLDIETSGSLNTNSNITEITLLKRNPNTNQIEKIFSRKIQVPEDVVKSDYMVDPDVLYKMYGGDFTEADYIKKFASATENYGEQQLLSDFYNTLAKQESHLDLMTHNGDDFDILFLQQKVKHYHIDNHLTPFNMQRKLRNLIFKNEQLATVPTFEEVLNKFNVRDSLKELSKDRFVFNKKLTAQVQSIVKEYIDSQVALEAVAGQLGRTVKFIDGIDSEFFKEIRGMVKIDNIGRPSLNTDWLQQKESIMDELASIDIFDDTLDKDFELSEIIKNKKLNPDIFKDSLDPAVKHMLYDLYTNGTELLRDVGYTNMAFRSIPLTSNLFEDTNKLMKVQNVLADLLPEGSEVAQILRKKPMQNLSQLLYAGVDYDPMLAYKKFEGSLWQLLDLSNMPVDTYNINTMYNYAKQIKKVGDNIYNLRELTPQKENVYAMLADLKKSNLITEATISKIDSENLQFTYASLEVLWRKIKYRAINGVETQFAAKKLVKEMSEKYSRLVNILDNDVIHYKMLTNTDVLRVENTASEFNFPEFLKFQNALEQSSEAKSILNMNLNAIDKVRITRDTATYKVKAMDTIWTMSNELVKFDELYNNSFVNGLPTKLTQSYINSGRLANEVLTAWETNQFLQLTPEQVMYKVINSGRGHSITLRKPSNRFFNNTEVFDRFSLQKSELNKLGITWDWNEETQRLTLGINDELASKIKLNKNVYTRGHHYEDGQLILGVRYKLNGEDVPEILLPEIDEAIFKKYVTGNKEYIDQMWTVRQGLIEMNPELSGRWGLVNYIDTYGSAKNNPVIPKFAKNKLEKTEDYLTYFNDWNLGEFSSRAEFVAGLNTDYRQQLNLLGRKMLDHSHAYLEYGQFIMQGGLRLDSDVIKKMPLKDLQEMLENNKDYVVVYLADNKNAVGGYTLRKLNTYTENTLKEVERIGATIIPWDQYELAARAINQFSYSNKFIRYWNKAIQLYKKGWLASLGTIIRNGMDSTLKNFAEGDSPTGVMKSYTEAFDLLHRFDVASREIKKLDPWGRFRLNNANEYFKLPNAKLDKETYQFLYDFMQNNGTNAVSTEIDGIFGILMKPNGWIERTSRLTQYLNLADQGLDYSNIMRKISQTHFNYDLKSYSAFIAQRYIPFYTYVSNNINYLVHLIEENPSFLRNFFNAYTAIWDIDSYDYEELAGNSSLQYQILNGNIPLEKLFQVFGYKDKEITRTVNTKYGPRQQKVTNTAVLKMGSSVLDGLMFFSNPIHNIKEKLAPPFQLAIDSYFEYQPSALGNIAGATYTSYEENEINYQKAFGSTSIQSIFKNPINLIPMIPGIGSIVQRATHTEYDENGNPTLALGTTAYPRTERVPLEVGALLGVTGVTSRWGEFINNTPKTYAYPSNGGANGSYPRRVYTKKVYPRKTYAKKTYATKLTAGTPRVNQSMSYRFSKYGNGYAYYTGYPGRTYTSGKRPYSKYEAFIAQIQKPNYTHRATSSNISGNMQTIPQYLYSYMGKNRQGKSKMLSWLRMSPQYKVKNTLRRLASL